MHQVTREDVHHNRPVRQFHGKWPFVRLLGVQEPASVLFSLLNGAAVVVGYHRFSTSSPSDYHLHSVLHVELLVSVNTWLWSAVFHTRDVGWTEKMDYFSAALLIVCGLIVQFIRLSGRGALLWQCLYGAVWMGLFLLHVAYLSMSERFNYGYNMAVCVIAGTVYAVVWTAWSIKEWRRRHYVWKCVVAVLWGSCTVLLELLDFPPLLWAVDAHALWHLSTAPIPLLWYSFLTDDAKYEMTRHKKQV
ncbi:Post-GPI attachment to proteins factor 3 [Geodia barretti]|nr:Post-GPI attachment to proteins factor 3 [Geodia barretti]